MSDWVTDTLATRNKTNIMDYSILIKGPFREHKTGKVQIVLLKLIS